VPRALPVAVLLDEAGMNVVALVAYPPKIPGVVQKNDAATGALTVKTDRGAETFTLVKNAEIKKLAAKTVADIMPGAAVDLHLGLNRTEVVAVYAAKVPDPEDDD
jgi:hypothetical protein